MTYSLSRAKNYSIIEVDLSVAHSEEEIFVPGDVLSIIAITGSMDIMLDDPEAPAIEAQNITRMVTRPEKWKYLYISNSAQAGKTAKLYVGREASFEALPQRSGNVGVLDTGSVQIDPLAEGGTVHTGVFAGLNYGEDTVATAGTAEALNGGTSLSVPPGSELLIRALDGNAGKVYVGDSGVSSADGYPLGAGDALSLRIDDVATVYIDVDNSGEGVRWIAEA